MKVDPLVLCVDLTFRNQLAAGDVEILIPATAEQPRLLRLGRAIIGKPASDQPPEIKNLFSHSSNIKIGIFDPWSEMGLPYNVLYQVENPLVRNGGSAHGH
ncbi:MAG: hypothetical protein BroJett011_42100 [Chloroflexota bacterium]|nr:MAG: hypothetical protein BroJett011_42100 [Chloroflexota bacterium]